ncbi:MAG: TatD family hydrolase [Patescibacteria group bacterium]|nr:TatD family hydrolase [Patescibacteria group bacterium]
MVKTKPRILDTHAHLDSKVYERDLDIIVNHALEEGVWIVTVGNDYLSSVKAVSIAERYPEGVYAAVGLHPLKIGAAVLAEDKLIDIGKFQQLASHPKVVAIGETGLDYHDLPTGKRSSPQAQIAERIKMNQKKVLARFLELSRMLRLPLMLHCREAHDEMLKMLEIWDKTTPGFDSRGVVHCFSGNWKQARRYFNLDFRISVTGIVTHGAYQGELLKKAPLSRLLAESDCPYLTPEPFSLRRNEPSYVTMVAANLAGLRKIPTEEVVKQFGENALEVFKKIPR